MNWRTKFKDEPIQFIAITDQEEKVVEPFLRKKPMHAWIGLDTDRSVFKDYGVTGIPHTVVVDKNGNIAAITHPTLLSENHLRDLLAGKKIAIASTATEGHSLPERVPAVSKPERESFFQVIIRRTEGGPSSSILGKNSLTLSGATVLNALCCSFSISSTRVVTSSALPEGRFDFIIKTPATEKEEATVWLRQAVETAFGLTAKQETREMDAFVLKAGQSTKHLAPTGSTRNSSISSGSGSLNCVNQSMSALASCMEESLNKTVIDEAGFTNQYDFQLLWKEKATGETDPAELARALQEQLGLELAPAMRSVELLVVAVANRQLVYQEIARQ